MADTVHATGRSIGLNCGNVDRKSKMSIGNLFEDLDWILGVSTEVSVVSATNTITSAVKMLMYFFF